MESLDETQKKQLAANLSKLKPKKGAAIIQMANRNINMNADNYDKLDDVKANLS